MRCGRSSSWTSASNSAAYTVSFIVVVVVANYSPLSPVPTGLTFVLVHHPGLSQPDGFLVCSGGCHHLAVLPVGDLLSPACRASSRVERCCGGWRLLLSGLGLPLALRLHRNAQLLGVCLEG